MTLSDSRVLTTSAKPEALEEFEGLLAKTWSESAHVPEVIRMQVGIAVAEIGANLIRHGGCVNIHMEVRALPHEVRVEFEDDGMPASVDLDNVSMPEDMAEAGRGLALAQAALAELSYRRDTVNRWTLVSKRFG